jgi:hypothetical protein
MEINNITSKDIKMDDSYKRYSRLHAIVNEIDSSPISRTTQWYVEHNHLLHIYMHHFGSFEGIHAEIENKEFRDKCVEVDKLIAKVTQEFNRYHWFSLIDYSNINKNLIWITDYVADFNDENTSLEDMFKSMNVS